MFVTHFKADILRLDVSSVVCYRANLHTHCVDVCQLNIIAYIFYSLAFSGNVPKLTKLGISAPVQCS
jgi:hypothetical protein